MSDLNLIKELREKTGAGFLDCKKSLEDNNNDIEKSVETLRKKGLAKASKKSDREANEGAVGVYSNKDITVLIKVNSETDFAAKSYTFLDFLDTLGQLVLDNNTKLDKETFLKKLEETIKYYVRLGISIKNSNALNDFYNSRKPENTIMSLGVDATHSFFKQNKYLDPFKEIIVKNIKNNETLKKFSKIISNRGLSL